MKLHPIPTVAQGAAVAARHAPAGGRGDGADDCRAAREALGRVRHDDPIRERHRRLAGERRNGVAGVRCGWRIQCGQVCVRVWSWSCSSRLSRRRRCSHSRPRRARHARPAERPHRDGGRQGPEAQALAARGDPSSPSGRTRRSRSTSEPKTQVIDLAGQLAIPGLHRRARPLPGRRPVAHGARPDGGQELGRDRGDGGRRRRRRRSRASGSRPRLAPGEVVHGAAAERRGFPHARRAQPGLARQPRVAEARERPRDASRTRRRWNWPASPRDTPNPAWRRDPEGRGGPADRRVPRDRLGADRRGARRLARRRRPRNCEAEARGQIELAIEESLSKGVTSFQDAGVVFETVDLYKKVADEGQLGDPPLGDGARHARAAGASKLATDRMVGLRRQPPHGARRSSCRSTARSARAAHGCSSPTATCRAARG